VFPCSSCIFFLDSPRIGKRDSRNPDRCFRGEKFAGETLLNQLRQSTDVILVGVGYHDNINLGGIKREGRVVSIAQFAIPLKNAAINQNLLAVGLNQMARTGNRVRGAAEFNGSVHAPFLPVKIARTDICIQKSQIFLRFLANRSR
jgi:hypothetical protein